MTVTAPLRYTAVAGDNLLVTFTVTNTGVTTDTFNLNFAQTKGWVNFVGLPAAVTLIAGASTTLQVPVSAPAGGVVGDVDQISLTAQSAGDSSKTAIGSTQVVINRSRVFLPITLRQ